MSLPAANPLDLVDRRLAWLDERQRVLAQNVANADTPGYRPSDLRPFAQLLAGASGRLALARSDAQHLRPPDEGAPLAVRDRSAAERTPDGNAVRLDQQAMKIAETDNAHALALGVHRRYLAMIRTALGRAG